MLLLAGLALAACRRAAPPPHVASVRLAESSLQELAASGVQAGQAIAAAVKALVGAGFVVAAGEPAWRARAELLSVRAVPRPGGAGLDVEVVADLELTPVQEGGVARREQGTGRVRGEASGAALAEALGSALGEAARTQRIGMASDQKPVEVLLKDLESSDPRLRDHAVQSLGERRERRAVRALMRRLRDGDDRLVARAVGALVQIGDPQAVPALIDLARDSAPEATFRLVPAVAEIGGPDAMGWLLTVSQAHPDPAVRRVAGEALAELEARGDGGARK
jgi:hypothetical protein